MEDNGSYAARLRRSFAENLRAARKSVGLSQSRLAKASGVTQKSISRVEAAIMNPTLSTMARLAESVSAEVPALLSECEGGMMTLRILRLFIRIPSFLIGSAAGWGGAFLLVHLL